MKRVQLKKKDFYYVQKINFDEPDEIRYQRDDICKDLDIHLKRIQGGNLIVWLANSYNIKLGIAEIDV